MNSSNVFKNPSNEDRCIIVGQVFDNSLNNYNDGGTNESCWWNAPFNAKTSSLNPSCPVVSNLWKTIFKNHESGLVKTKIGGSHACDLPMYTSIVTLLHCARWDYPSEATWPCDRVCGFMTLEIAEISSEKHTRAGTLMCDCPSSLLACENGSETSKSWHTHTHPYGYPGHVCLSL